MKFEEIKLGKKSEPSFLPIALCALLFPASILFWTANYFFPWVTGNDFEDQTPSPNRWLISVGASVILTAYGLKKKSLNISGALCAFFVGFFLTLGSYCFLVSLMLFFLSSSRATKFRQHQKKKFEDHFKEGGQRNWIQVICNGGMAMELAILYIIDVGVGERPINFVADYRPSWLGLAILGALSCANGDTWASEFGSVLKTTVPRLITTLKKVPTGTNGGITLGGTVCSALGGMFIGVGYYFTILFTVDEAILRRSPPQWPLVILGMIGGLLGSFIDSVMGATLQYSGVDESGKIRESPGRNIKHISGIALLDNHSVNLISTILTGVLLPPMAFFAWKYF